MVVCLPQVAEEHPDDDFSSIYKHIYSQAADNL